MSAVDYFLQLPAVTRTLVASSVVMSVSVYTGLLPYGWIIFHPSFFGFSLQKFPPQIWRLVTSFLLTAPKLGMIMDPFFLYQYGSALETESSRFSKKSDFVTYVAFVQLVILALCSSILGGLTFLDALTLAFAYTYSQDNPSRRVSFFIITLDARFLPLLMLAMTFVLGGPDAALKQSSGLLAAHLYDFLTRIWPTFGGGRNFIRTPSFLSRIFGDDQATTTVRGYGTAIAPGSVGGRVPATAPQGRGQGQGWTSALPNWSSRGQGRRLGGN